MQAFDDIGPNLHAARGDMTRFARLLTAVIRAIEACLLEQLRAGFSPGDIAPE